MSTISSWKALQAIGKKITSNNIKKLYMKDGLLAVNKPYGIPVHGGSNVKNSILQLFPEIEARYHLPAGSLSLAHRLDKNTSGVLLLTYEKQMAKRLSDMFQRHQIEKTYLAILLGVVKRQNGVLKGNIVEMIQSGQYKQTVGVDMNKPSHEIAKTTYSILDNSKKTCFLCTFKTFFGQKHQIRVHASEVLHCPILGDHIYHGGPKGPQVLPVRLIQMLRMQGVQNKQTGITSKIRPWQRGLLPMHLLAKSVLLPGLDNGEDVTIKASIPSYFQKTMDYCDLVMNREEVDARLLKLKQKRINRMRESIFIPKVITNSKLETAL